MTLHTLLLILLWSLIGILFVAVLILAFIYGRSTIKDHPDQALVLVKTGRHVAKPVKARLVVSSKQGTAYKYDSIKKVVIIPAGYDDIFCRGLRLVFVNRIGQLIASPFDKEDKKIFNEMSSVERENLIYDIIESKVGADGMKALKGTSKANTLIIAIVAFAIGAAAVFLFNNFQDMQKQNQVTQQQQQQQQNIRSEVK